ncbi:MAG: hypothetical protein EWV54_15300 [Microcystis novacekii Mn_MB_F_20050700_S1D]|uniref:Uncharacterized protein n=1 Tax=Microcystis novacekii Mn_MB_F_20050700_S1D TaxID=2486266 RepID=A0A552IR14_9CHRO|nr:MAG: hypothetical protein EWV54_15300 [Microcystis novacekii Mn_MB_F_20050700_S1D]
MLDESVFVIQGEDVNQVKALLFSQVVNCDKEWDESETINSEFPPDAWDPLKIDLRDDDIPI